MPLTIAFDDFIAFSDPATCQETKTFRKFLWDLIEWYDEFKARKGKITAPPLVASVMGPIRFDKGTYGFVAMVPAKGRWKNFDLVSISSFAPESGDPPNFYLHLAAPVEDVADRLKADGFDVIAGETRTIADGAGAYDILLSVTPHPEDSQTTLFGCGLG